MAKLAGLVVTNPGGTFTISIPDKSISQYQQMFPCVTFNSKRVFLGNVPHFLLRLKGKEHQKANNSFQHDSQ